VIAASLLFTAACVAGLPRLEADFSADSFLPPGDDIRRRYDTFRDHYGLDGRTIVAIETKDVFDLEFLALLREIHERIEAEIPHVDEVKSLYNARVTRGSASELIVEELSELYPESEDELVRYRERVLSNPLYENLLFSRDRTLACLLIKPLTYSSIEVTDQLLDQFDAEEESDAPDRPAYLSPQESDDQVRALHALIAPYDLPGRRVHLVGENVAGERAGSLSERDSKLFGAVAFGVMAAALLALFRRAVAMLLALGVVLLSLISTFGVMAWLGIPFAIPTQILSNFIMAVGICDAVHILVIYYQRSALASSRRELLSTTLAHTGLGVILTSLTTAGGLASFSVALIAPVSNLGIIAPIGVMITLGYTLTLLPAILAVTPLPAPDTSGQRIAPRLSPRLIVRLGRASSRHPWPVLAVTLGVIVIAGSGVARLRFSHDSTSWLFPGDPVRVATEAMNERLRGIYSVEILVDSGKENGLYSPETLRRIETAMQWIEEQDGGPVPVGKVTSIVDIVKEIHQALNENRASHHAIPDDRLLIAQELLLFENSGSEDLQQVADTRLQIARITARTGAVDGMLYGPFLDGLEAQLRRILGPELSFELTGGTVLHNRAFKALLESMARSYALALLIITPLMVFMIGRWQLGLASMLPNLLPVWLTLALMGWSDITLNISTLLVGSIVIGLAVDDTIHFLHNFNRSYSMTGDVTRAVEETLATTGAALFVTSVILAASFATFMLGSMTGITQFGLLAGFATVVAFLADIVISPALASVVIGARSEEQPDTHDA
jgi:predicted RND superfamily exporter protein